MSALRIPSLVLSLLLLLASCAPPAQMLLLPEPHPGAANVEIFAISNREFEAGRFTAERMQGLDYTRFTVSVPPDREVGEIEWPRHRPDPERHFMLSAAERFSAPAGLYGDLRLRLNQLPPAEREVVLFVHGYNNNFESGLFRLSQLFHDYEAPSVPVYFSWPSAAHPLGYAYDRESAIFSRDALEQVIRDLGEIQGMRILLVAHSMGSHLTMETLRQIRISGDDAVLQRLSGVVLMAPDIDIEVFQAQARRLEPLPRPFVIFTSQEDRALTLSAWISGHENRLGSLGTIEDVSEFPVTMIDTTAFAALDNDSVNHSTFATSPALIRLISGLPALDGELDGPAVGLLPGTVLRVRNATQVLLQPNIE